MSSKFEINKTKKITPVITRPLDAIVSGNKEVIVGRVVAGSSVNDDTVDLALRVNHPPTRGACAVMIVGQVLSHGEDDQSCLTCTE